MLVGLHVARECPEAATVLTSAGAINKVGKWVVAKGYDLDAMDAVD